MNAKEENVREMLMEMGKLYKNMQDSELKDEYGKFLLMMSSGSVPLEIVLGNIEGKIRKAMEARSSTTTSVNSKTVVQFWKNIRDLIVETYKENKEMD